MIEVLHPKCPISSATRPSRPPVDPSAHGRGVGVRSNRRETCRSADETETRSLVTRAYRTGLSGARTSAASGTPSDKFNFVPPLQVQTKLNCYSAGQWPLPLATWVVHSGLGRAFHPRVPSDPTTPPHCIHYEGRINRCWLCPESAGLCWAQGWRAHGLVGPAYAKPRGWDAREREAGRGGGGKSERWWWPSEPR